MNRRMRVICVCELNDSVENFPKATKKVGGNNG